MNSDLFLDESGDLGFTFNAPYRNGGSSKYLTIGYILCDSIKTKLVKRIVHDTYKKFGFDVAKEKKATKLKPHHKNFICQEIIKLCNAESSCKIGAITVKKQNVGLHIQTDPNKLYNYICAYQY